jgi:hypothetical protein
VDTFSEFLEQYKDSYGYVSVEPSYKSIYIISDIINKSKIIDAISPSDLHMTLMYDTDNPLVKSYSEPDNIITATMREVVILGDALVILLDSEDAHNRFNQLCDLGFNPSYPEYIPHISLKYNPTENDLVKIRKVFKQYKDSEIQLQDETWNFNTGN